MPGLIDCTVIAPDALRFQGPVRCLTVSDSRGRLQLWPLHAETFVALRPGDIVLRRPDGTDFAIPAAGGVLHLKDDVAKIVL